MHQMIVDINEARKVIREVLDDAHTTVVGTMGPNGHLVMIASGDSTQTTKDGVTVARALKWADPLRELINRVITEPAIKTDEECGDGTTTTIHLTWVLTGIWERWPGFVAGRNIEKTVKALTLKLIEQSQRVDVKDPLLDQLALTSSNQDTELAEKVISVYRSTDEGYPDIELGEGRGGVDLVQRIEGRVLKMYYSSPGFGAGMTGGERVLNAFYPIVLDDRLIDTTYDQLERAFVGHFEKRVTSDMVNFYVPVVLVVRSIEQKVISDLYRLMAQPHLSKYLGQDSPSVYVMATNMGGTVGSAEMQDLASILGAPLINGVEDIAHISVAPNFAKLTLGSARSKIDNLTEVDLARINTQIASIEKLVSEYSFQDRFTLRARVNDRRMRNLRGQVVTILVGGETNQEIRERTDRYQDVVKAVRSALENGVLPGCGMGLVNAARQLLNDPEHSLPEQLTVLEELGMSIYNHLNETKLSLTDELTVTNLATGVTGTSEEVGVWDTAYATITALKGGLQTAKILSNTQAVITTNKLAGRSITR